MKRNATKREEIPTAAGIGTFRDIMVIEDSSVMRKMIINSLKAAGMNFKKVIEANDGEEALEKIGNNKLDIIFVVEGQQGVKRSAWW